MAAIIIWIYGGLVLAGGIMGWAKARSLPSLIAGVVFGALLIWTGFLLKNTTALGGILAFALPALLAVVMGKRYAQTKKFMPAGLMVILSLVVVLLLLAVKA